jgi:hypothetical protein
MSSDIETRAPSAIHPADYYYKQWKQLKEIGRQVLDRGQKKIRLGHPIICDLARMLNLYELINEEAYRHMQQRIKESDQVDVQWIYDWISEEKIALKTQRELGEKTMPPKSDQT